MKHNFKLKISIWTGFVKETTWIFTRICHKDTFHGCFCCYKDFTLIIMFVGEWTISQKWQYDRKKRDPDSARKRTSKPA
jgi:hypothetical protein